MITSLENPFLAPRRRPIRGGDRHYDVKSTRAWITSLPMGDAMETGHEIAQRLFLMNRTAMPPRERVQSLETLLAPLGFVFEEMTEKTLKLPPPLSKRQLSQLRLADSLRILLIQGYKAALEQFHRDSGLRQVMNKHVRVLAAHRVLHFLGEMVLNAYRCYRTPPPYTWRELHGIYNYTRECGIHSKSVTDEQQEIPTRSDCTHLYKQTLLLATANPFRLQRGEAELLTRELRDWSTRCQLRTLDHRNRQRGLFLIDIGADSPPRYRNESDDRLLTKGWVLDTAPLSRILTKLHENLQHREPPSGRPDNALSPDLLSRLMLAWGIRPERCARRESSTGEVNVACGVEAVVRNLCEDPALNRRAAPDDADVVLSPGELNRMGWDLRKKPSIQSFDYSEFQGRADFPRFAPNRSATAVNSKEFHSCTICNRSNLGIHLKQRDLESWSISVGDLIGIEAAGGQHVEQHSQLGIVRWMQTDDRERADFGVQLLDGTPEPVFFRLIESDDESSVPFPGLLLFAEKKRPTLILPPTEGIEQRELSFSHKNIRLRITLGHAVESTNSFGQYLFGSQGATEKRYPSGESTAKEETKHPEIDFKENWGLS